MSVLRQSGSNSVADIIPTDGDGVNVRSQRRISEDNEIEYNEFHDAFDTEAAFAECKIDNNVGDPEMAMDLDKALDEAKLAINCFFNNKFDEARELMKPWINSSMYHSVGYAVFAFLEAMLTFEQQHIEAASDALKQCLNVCARHRHKQTITESLIGKTFKRINYAEYTDVESHAELCSAEALLLKAMLTFIEDETLTSLLKGGIKIRTCFNSYKECHQILVQRKWESESSRNHFESGVRMGVGTFNLMISLLPARIIRLLEFIGFSGNRKTGMDDLIAGADQQNGIRQILCVMTLLGYHLIVCYVLSHQEGDLIYCDRLLSEQLAKHPDGVWFLFFKGRLEFMKGNLNESLRWYERSWKSQSVWPQFHHLCYWELLWVNCLQLKWHEASKYADNLLNMSKWSRTIYSYQKAIILLAQNNYNSHNDDDNLDQSGGHTSSKVNKNVEEIERLMNEVPLYKQRIAGKSLPMEKFACKRAERYTQQGGNLVLAAIELMYLWNLFKILGKQFELGDNVLRLIELEQKRFNETGSNKSSLTSSSTCDTKYDADNRALILLLKGACLRQLNSPLQSLKCLEAVITLQRDIREDHYLIPYAIVEMALLYIDQNRIENAIAALEDAKKNYTGYSLESRLHFRIHTALTDLKSRNNTASPSSQ